MNTITIPQKLVKNDDLVVVPRRDYERLMRFWTSAAEITKKEKLAIERGFREIKHGKFLTSKQLKHELGL